MFGSKSRRIAELETALQSAETRCRTHAQYLGYAEEIGRRITEMAQDPSRNNVARELDIIVGSLEAEARQKKLSELFGQLAPETRLELLGQTFPDDEMREMLARERQTLLERQAAPSSIETLKLCAERERRINIDDLPKDTRLKISLFDKDDFEEAESPSELLDSYEPYRTIVAISKNRRVGHYRSFLIINDSFDNDFTPVPVIERHKEVYLGNRIDNFVQPWIYYGIALDISANGSHHTFTLKGESQDISLVVGQVKVDGKEVMGSNLPLDD